MGPQPLWQYGAGWMEQNSQLLFNTFTKAVWKIYANAKIPMQYIFWIETFSFKKKPCQPLQMLEQDSLFFCFFFGVAKKMHQGKPPPSFPSSALLDSSCILQQNSDSQPRIKCWVPERPAWQPKSRIWNVASWAQDLPAMHHASHRLWAINAFQS